MSLSPVQTLFLRSPACICKKDSESMPDEIVINSTIKFYFQTYGRDEKNVKNIK